jgi:hypothetical protein
MKTSQLTVHVAGAAVALLIAAGCNGAGMPSQFASSNANQANAAHSAVIPTLHNGLRPNYRGGTPKLRHANGRSWMSAKAVPYNLLYIADTFAGEINVYSWRLLKQVGTLTGFSEPYTFCVDKAQNVYIADFGLQEVFEYAHGGTSSINSLSTNGDAISCSVDPTTGNLAVVNFVSNSGDGNVLVYTNASGSPKEYSVPNLDEIWFAAYDSKGNLFVNGEGGSGVGLAELPAGGSSFEVITANVSFGFPGGVFWDGKYLDVGDQSSNIVYQFTVSGTNATEQGSLDLGDSSDVFQFTIPKFGSGKVNPQGNRLVAADFSAGDAYKYLYPAGGTPTKTLTGFDGPEGAIVSKGKK